MSGSRMHAVLAVALVAAGLAGCGGRSPPGSAEFKRGYIDGCDSGYADANRPGYETVYYKDEKRFETDAEYRKGWIEGQKACYEAEHRFPHMGTGEGEKLM